MEYRPEQPLIVQADWTVLLETDHPQFETARAMLGQFAELIKTPEHIHTYRMTPLSLWNAAAAGLRSEQITGFLQTSGKFALPPALRQQLTALVDRYGRLRLEPAGDLLQLVADEPQLVLELLQHEAIAACIAGQPDELRLLLQPAHRGLLKQQLTRLGYPVLDLAGYHQGETLPMTMSPLKEGELFQLRDYQQQAVDAFYREGSVLGGSGVLVLPCGAGKTVIGIAALARLNCAALILTTNVTSVRQWKREILASTSLTADQVGEYSGERKEVKPVTIATYQILTFRKAKEEPLAHMALFNERDWGLIIYDEVHLLPAPVFRVTADIQAKRRLGLTATLVREDGCEADVFSLVGPKRFDMPWKELERQGWIATVGCAEIRVPLDETVKQQYAAAEPKQQFRVAGENPLKLRVVKQLLERHADRPALIIGQYIDQLKHISQELDAPLISGEMPHHERDELYDRFKAGELPRLVVSKVANFAVDLPDASLAIQISGSFGSRQEEAQRLGRILRPKQGDNTAFFYSLVSQNTKEQQFALNRQLFLVERGYRYDIIEAKLPMDGQAWPDKANFEAISLSGARAKAEQIPSTAEDLT